MPRCRHCRWRHAGSSCSRRDTSAVVCGRRVWCRARPPFVVCVCVCVCVSMSDRAISDRAVSRCVAAMCCRVLCPALCVRAHRARCRRLAVDCMPVHRSLCLVRVCYAGLRCVTAQRVMWLTALCALASASAALGGCAHGVVRGAAITSRAMVASVAWRCGAAVCCRVVCRVCRLAPWMQRCCRCFCCCGCGCVSCCVSCCVGCCVVWAV
jgi:hypothetical protein